MTRLGLFARVLALCLGVVFISTLSACNSCSSKRALAVLTKEQKRVERDYAGKVGKWHAAAVGVTFSVGDGVRTGDHASAELKLEDGSRLKLQANTTLRFLNHPPGKGQAALDVETGEATVHVGNSPLQLETSFGAAKLEAGSVVRLRRSGSGLRYEVSVGMATLAAASGKVDVKAGHGVEIGVGKAVVESYALKPEPSAPASASASATPPVEPPATGDIAAQVQGRGSTERRPGDTSWSKLAPGSTSLPSGTTLRVARGNQIDVSRGGATATLHGAGQYVLGPVAGTLVQAQQGSLSLTGGKKVTINVPGGSIVAEQAAHADLVVDAHATKVAVSAGVLHVQRGDKNETLLSGEQATLGPKGIDVRGRGPKVADFFIDAGSSVTVHDPRPPTALGVRFAGKCSKAGLIELLRGRSRVAFSRGEGSANVAVPPGAYSYRLRCLGDGKTPDSIAAKGRVVVLHDAGTLALPRSSPPSLVDADGRNYTILYQNLLPQVTVRWPNAPKTDWYTLKLTSRGRARTFTSKSPVYAMKPGAVREGTHRLTFSGGGYQSRTTTLIIRFDNAAPKASIEQPANGSFAPGATVHVAGTALPGWKVVVNGTSLTLDAQSRFAGSAVAPTGQRALVIQLIHPPYGAAYYLRRSRAGS